MTLLDELQSAVSSVADRVGPAIVGIGRHQRGSGVVIANGQILTNAHNLRGEEVTVTFADGRRERGTVRAADIDGDLAVISVDTGATQPVVWSEAQDLTVGTPVLGAAASHDGATRITFGLVSSVARAFRGPGGRRIAGSVEHTAPLAPGSSGGALLGLDGSFLGLNTNRIGDGFYLALPADASLRARIDALGEGDAPERPRLGIAVAPSHVARRLRRSVGLPERDGVLVRDVMPNGPAAAAGIAKGDLIVSAGGADITDADDLHDALASNGLPVDLVVIRGTDERTVRIKPAARGADES